MNKALMGLLVAFALSTNAQAGEALARSKGCLACHAIDKKLVGPAFQEVAGKYAGQGATELAAKVMQGGKGNWGPVPMPPNKVTPDEAAALVAWILGLK